MHEQSQRGAKQGDFDKVDSLQKQCLDLQTC